MSELQNWATFADVDDEPQWQSEQEREDLLQDYLAAVHAARLAHAKPVQLGRISRRLGHLYWKGGQYDEAQRALHDYRDQLVEVPTDEARLELALTQLEITYVRLDVEDVSPQIGEEAQRVVTLLRRDPPLQSTQAKSIVGQALVVQSIIAHEQGRFDEFERLSKEAAVEFGYAGDKVRQWDVKFNQATSNMRRGRLAAAIKGLEECKLALDKSQRRQAFSAPYNLAYAYLSNGDLRRALDNAMECLREAQNSRWIFQVNALQALVEIFKEIAVVASNLGWGETAKTFVNRVQEAGGQGAGIAEQYALAPQEINFKDQYVYQFSWMSAEAFLAIDDMAQAREALKQAHVLAMDNEEFLSQEMEGEVERVEALFAMKAGDWNEALSWLQAAQTVFDCNGYNGKVVKVRLAKAQAHIASGDFNTAEQELQAATITANKLGDSHSKFRISRLLQQAKAGDTQVVVTKPITLAKRKNDMELSRLLEIARTSLQKQAELDGLVASFFDNLLAEQTTTLTRSIQEERMLINAGLKMIVSDLAPSSTISVVSIDTSSSDGLAPPVGSTYIEAQLTKILATLAVLQESQDKTHESVQAMRANQEIANRILTDLRDMKPAEIENDEELRALLIELRDDIHYLSEYQVPGVNTTMRDVLRKSAQILDASTSIQHGFEVAIPLLPFNLMTYKVSFDSGGEINLAEVMEKLQAVLAKRKAQRN